MNYSCIPQEEQLSYLTDSSASLPLPPFLHCVIEEIKLIEN